MKDVGESTSSPGDRTELRKRAEIDLLLRAGASRALTPLNALESIVQFYELLSDSYYQIELTHFCKDKESVNRGMRPEPNIMRREKTGKEREDRETQTPPEEPLDFKNQKIKLGSRCCLVFWPKRIQQALSV